jgi:hypothetical protein
MPKYTQHELLCLQEHIRGEAASSQSCRQFAQVTTDPDLRAFCEQEAQTSEQNVQRLMALFNQGQMH